MIFYCSNSEGVMIGGRESSTFIPSAELIDALAASEGVELAKENNCWKVIMETDSTTTFNDLTKGEGGCIWQRTPLIKQLHKEKTIF